MKTKKLLVRKATAGMTVAEDVYTEGNQLVVPKNTVLTSRVISRLKFFSIYEICIFDTPPEPEVQDLIDNRKAEGYLARVRQTKEFKRFNKAFLISVDNVKNSLDLIVKKGDPVRADQLIVNIEKLIKESRNGLHLLDMIHCVRNYDDSTYVHSINVALLCHIIGEWLGFPKKDIDVLTMSGLLHDIGKIMIPKEIIGKPSKLTPEEFAIIQSHPVHGYHILKDQKIDKRIKYATLMHHERCDGSGYPLGNRSEDIAVFAKIVAIADVYDAMTSNRVYRGASCPFEVIEIFEKDGLTKYDPEYLLKFLERVVQSYINNTVQLNNKQIGTVVMINKNSLSKPVVCVESDFIDLSIDRKLFIEVIL